MCFSHVAPEVGAPSRVPHFAQVQGPPNVFVGVKSDIIKQENPRVQSYPYLSATD